MVRQRSWRSGLNESDRASRGSPATTGDNDPVVLLSALALALDRIEPVDPEIFQMLASSGAGITAVPRFVSGIASMRRPVTVLLDHTEAVTNKQCL